MVWRSLKHIKRQPEMLTDVTIQPVMFVLLFAFVFGGSIQTDSGSYREWLLPGIMAQTMAFSSFIVAIGLNMDLGKGIIDRFRSLPISRGSVLVGRSIYAILHSSIGIFVMSITGLLIGWRIRDGFGNAVLAFALLVLFGFAMIWIGILVGSAMRSPEAVNGLMFTTIFPVTFLANTFAPDRRDAAVAAHDRRVEPDQLTGAGDARAVGQRSQGAGRRCPSAPASGPHHGDLVGGHHRRRRAAGRSGVPASHHRLTA